MGQSLKRLVQMFSDISHIEKAKNNIAVYVMVKKNIVQIKYKKQVFFRQKQIKNFRLPNFIASYLTAWYRKWEPDEKVFLLNEHITTVQKYLIKRKRDFDVLIGIQIFFYREDIKENKSKSILSIEYVMKV